MEDRKNMILVSPETLHRYEQHHQQVASATNIVLSELDKEMEKILASKLDNSKWTLYQQVLQRYLQFSQHPPPPENTTTTTTPEVFVLPISTVFNTVPVQARKNAELLLEHINSRGCIIWDENGEMSIHDTPLLGSNIVDLVNDLVRARRHSEPSGSRPLQIRITISVERGGRKPQQYHPQFTHPRFRASSSTNNERYQLIMRSLVWPPSRLRARSLVWPPSRLRARSLVWPPSRLRAHSLVRKKEPPHPIRVAKTIDVIARITFPCAYAVRMKERPHPIRVAKTIDVIARIVIPSAYAIFLIFFFIQFKS
uniref:Uncharacterized protein n=1 Tax=Timema tahoe TaxID=61484 RepID=A0A7R9INL6_9NEOP|nr:unnamed protein product [Timema tahoe]